MAFYREIDGYITRDYSLLYSAEQYTTENGLLDIVPSRSFDEMVFLNGELQFTRKDEYIYHEMLIHPAMSSQIEPTSVCILGGGDGCAVREVLKWPSVQSIDLYDYDKDLVNLFTHRYSSWNNQSLSHPNVNIHIKNVKDIPLEESYHAIFVDLIDPNCDDDESIEVWETLIAKLPFMLKPTGSLVLNAGSISPWNTKNIEWLLFLLSKYFQINTTHTLEAYKVFVPSFASEWCFIFLRPIESSLKLSMFQENNKIRYFDEDAWRIASTWTKDVVYSIPRERVKLNGYLPPL